MTPTPSRTAQIRALAQHDVAEAQRALSALLGDLFEMRPCNVRINFGKYSLNSLNGFFDDDGKAYFFKFHQEEREEAMTGEYYRAEILSRAGLPVDQPVHMSAHCWRSKPRPFGGHCWRSSTGAACFRRIGERSCDQDFSCRRRWS